MAEIGLVKFATIALQVGQAALPAYRSKFAKRRYTQPPLLAILCLMRYEGTVNLTFPKAVTVTR
jgi:hypothetical protein